MLLHRFNKANAQLQDVASLNKGMAVNDSSYINSQTLQAALRMHALSSYSPTMKNMTGKQEIAKQGQELYILEKEGMKCASEVTKSVWSTTMP